MKKYQQTLMDERCNGCKFFKFGTSAVLSWGERFEMVKNEHPTLNEAEAKTLADNKDLFAQKQSDYGKCGNKSIPELRDTELNSKMFGCIYFKKK